MVVFPMTIGVVLAPFRAVSPMKPDVVPDTGRRAPPQSLQPSSSSINTRSHISNLERVLLRTVPRAPSHFPPSSSSSSSVRSSGGLLQNLSSLFSSDEVSPRGLARLQRLLSDSARPSPKSSIASQWRILHGAHDWAGLLNPLDENLRRELIRYGELVQSAYQAFLSIPSAPFTLPDRSYRFTCTLSASSSLQIPPWIRTSAPSRIGFVAVCDDDREIARMGRRDIVISLRGTATALEWAENLRTTLRPLPGSQMSKVSSGFLSLYKSTGDSNPSLSTAVIDEIRRLIRKYAGEELSITIAGHSLGAALAILIADELTEEIENAPPVAVISFGGPRVGNRAFAERVERKGVKVLRVVNANDFVTRVPGVLPDLGHEGYVHVGAELRVDNRDSPYLKPNADPACCHDLEAYLHLVDGFLGTGCPFRSNAKRNLARLLSQQRPNVKKIYVSRMRSLQAARSDRTVGVHQGCLVSPSR